MAFPVRSSLEDPEDRAPAGRGELGKLRLALFLMVSTARANSASVRMARVSSSGGRSNGTSIIGPLLQTP
jgi:hypothetical protein